MPLTSGARLGAYEIVDLLGAGGMGEVYRARDARLGRDVAIKVLPTAFSADPDRLQRFEQEARAAAALNHPNVLGIFDIGAHDVPRMSFANFSRAPRCVSASTAARSRLAKRSRLGCRSLAALRPLTRAASSIAISSQRTCSSPPMPVSS